MITRVRIKNYRSIEEVDVQLGPLTVLVGRNGSGKSTFLDALKFVRDALRVGLENAVISRGGMGSIQRWTPDLKHDVEIYIEFDGEEVRGHYEIRIRESEHGAIVESEKVSYKSVEAVSVGGKEFFFQDSFIRERGIWTSAPSELVEVDETSATVKILAHPSDINVLALPGLSVFSDFADVIEELNGNFYSIFPNTLRLPQKPLAERILNDQGENFISILQQVTKNPNLKTGILTSLSQAVEGVSDIRVTHAGGFLVGELYHTDLGNHGNSPWFDLSQESDGTLRMLGLLTALYQRIEGNSLLAIEEPELSLYPQAIDILSEEIKAASLNRQIIITTQSPDLISSFDAADIRVVSRKAGKTNISPLAEYQVEVLEKELFSSGDLLRIHGLHGQDNSGL